MTDEQPLDLLARPVEEQDPALDIGNHEVGQVVVTGVCPYPRRLAPGDVIARADYTTLGGVTVRVRVAW